MDVKSAQKRLVAKIKKYFRDAGKSKAVLGLSGGVDSAVVAALLVRAIGAENVFALILPNTSITKSQNIVDAQNLANSLGIKHNVIEIDSFLHAFSQMPWPQNDLAKANLNARVRAVIIYNFSNSIDCLVAGTGNKSEFCMGYFTKYGDGAADFFPIGSLYKKDVYALARHMKLPNEFIEKAPSAELWANQEDEREMGIKYEELDYILPILLKEKEGKLSSAQKKIAQKILKAMKATAHKREAAPIF